MSDKDDSDPKRPPLERIDELDSEPPDDAPQVGPEHLDESDDAPIVVPPERVRIADPRERPEVRVTLELHEVVDHAVAALAGADAETLRYTGHPAGGDPNLFERAHELVTVIRADEKTSADERSPIARGTPLIREVSAATMLERLTRYARFARARKPGKRQADMIQLATLSGKKLEPERFEPCPPPAAVVNAALARGAWRGVRSLTGISETPFMRANGTICQEPGYDDATGFLYTPRVDYPIVRESPSQQDAADALNDLSHVFCDFPYADPAHAMVPIAALLTVLARPALPNASTPAFIFDAATRGSGKTLQCDVVSLVATARFAARKGFPEKEEEDEKVVGAYALAGTPIILLDNIKRELGGANARSRRDVTRRH